MKNISQMMQQAQKMQVKMEELQANFDAVEIIGVSGGYFARNSSRAAAALACAAGSLARAGRAGGGRNR